MDLDALYLRYFTGDHEIDTSCPVQFTVCIDVSRCNLHSWYSHYPILATLEPGRLQNVGGVRVPSSVECRPLWHLSSLVERETLGFWKHACSCIHRLTVQSPVRSGQGSKEDRPRESDPGQRSNMQLSMKVLLRPTHLYLVLVHVYLGMHSWKTSLPT